MHTLNISVFYTVEKKSSGVLYTSLMKRLNLFTRLLMFGDFSEEVLLFDKLIQILLRTLVEKNLN